MPTYAFALDRSASYFNVVDQIRSRLPYIAGHGTIPDLTFEDGTTDLAVILLELTGGEWAVVPEDEMLHAAVQMGGMGRLFVEESPSRDIAAYGLAFCVGDANDGPVEVVDRSAPMRRVSDRIVAIVIGKDSPRMATEDEMWVGVSAFIESQVGGHWTCRNYNEEILKLRNMTRKTSVEDATGHPDTETPTKPSRPSIWRRLRR